jgi:hypothetical protein
MGEKGGSDVKHRWPLKRGRSGRPRGDEMEGGLGHMASTRCGGDLGYRPVSGSEPVGSSGRRSSARSVGESASTSLIDLGD